MSRFGYCNYRACSTPGFGRGLGSGSYVAETIDGTAAAIKSLKELYNPEHTILLGQSGGANIAANVAIRHQGLVDGLGLVDCPCDLYSWRGHHTPDIISPINRADEIGVPVILLAGGEDENTHYSLSQKFFNSLSLLGQREKKIKVFPGYGHGRTVNSAPKMSRALRWIKKRVDSRNK